MISPALRGPSFSLFSHNCGFQQRNLNPGKCLFLFSLWLFPLFCLHLVSLNKPAQTETMGSLCLGVGHWKHRASRSCSERDPLHRCGETQRARPPQSVPPGCRAGCPHPPPAVRMGVAGPPWLLLGEGLVLYWAPPSLGGVHEMGFLTEAHLPACRATHGLNPGHPPSGGRVLDSTPFHWPPAARRSPRLWFRGLSLLEPISLWLLPDLSLSCEGPGDSRDPRMRDPSQTCVSGLSAPFSGPRSPGHLPRAPFGPPSPTPSCTSLPVNH